MNEHARRVRNDAAGERVRYLSRLCLVRKVTTLGEVSSAKEKVKAKTTMSQTQRIHGCIATDLFENLSDQSVGCTLPIAHESVCRLHSETRETRT